MNTRETEQPLINELPSDFVINEGLEDEKLIFDDNPAIKKSFDNNLVSVISSNQNMERTLEHKVGILFMNTREEYIYSFNYKREWLVSCRNRFSYASHLLILRQIFMHLQNICTKKWHHCRTWDKREPDERNEGK